MSMEDSYYVFLGTVVLGTGQPWWMTFAVAGASTLEEAKRGLEDYYAKGTSYSAADEYKVASVDNDIGIVLGKFLHHLNSVIKDFTEFHVAMINLVRDIVV